MDRRKQDPADGRQPAVAVTSPHRGTIRVGGARMALLDVAGGFFMIRKILEEDLGVVEKDLMFRAGMEGAASFISSATESGLIQADADGFRTAIDTYALAGFGDFCLEQVCWERSSAVVSCKDPFEGWAYVRNHFPRDDAACDYSRGVLAGFMRFLRNAAGADGSGVVCAESQCIAKGDGACLFAIGPAEQLRQEGYKIPLPVKSIRDQLASLRRQVERQKLDLHEVYGLGGLVGKSHAMRKVYALVCQASSVEVPVLIQGELGTRKDLIARTIHHTSDRRDGPLVRIDCASLALPVLEVELLGSEQAGAAARQGALEAAQGGSLLLEQITALPAPLQQTLLEAIQTGRFRRVGGDDLVELDVRLIVAASHPVQEAVEHGAFLEELFTVLRGVFISVPPLRQRLEDVPLLADHFLAKHGQQQEGARLSLSRAALAALLQYDWPGNVAELKQVIDQAALRCAGEKVAPEDLALQRSSAAAAELYVTGTLRNAVERAEKRIILAALRQNRWRRGKTAKQLGVTRATLYNKMRKYQILNP